MTDRDQAIPKNLSFHTDIIDREMRKNNELSSVELAHIFLARCNIDVSPQTVRLVRKKLGWSWSGTKLCQLIKDVNKPKRMEHCLKTLSDRDDLEDIIFSDKCSVTIESTDPFIKKENHND